MITTISFIAFILFSSSCNKEELFSELDQFQEEEISAPEDSDEDFLVLVLENDSLVTSKNTSVKVDMFANDKNVPKGKGKLSRTEPSNGDLTVDDNGTPSDITDDTLLYTPNLDFVGEDSFEYSVESDTIASQNVPTATVTISVEPINSSDNYPTSGDHIFYVTTAGKSTNSGKTETEAWSIQHAFETAKAGDVVYIKAGNYGALNLTVANSGNSSNPIRFIGYKITPGDVIANNGSTFTYGDRVDGVEMPLIQGNRTNDVGVGTGISCSRSYVELSNFQVKYYSTGVYFSGDYSKLNNVITAELGDFNPANSNNPAYKGRGIDFNSDHGEIENCVVLNAGAQGLTVTSSVYQVHRYNSVYSDNTANPCDYYYLITSSGGNSATVASSNNNIYNAHVERVGDLAHGGHGLIAKYLATNNNFYDCTIVNTNLELSYNKASNNNFYRCVVDGKGGHGSINVRDGSHDNYFEECTVFDSGGASFMSNAAATDMLPEDLSAGYNNFFYNCTFRNMKYGIQFFWWPQEFKDNSADNNTFENCTFEDLNALFAVDRENSGTVLTNCNFANISDLRGSRYSENNNIPLDFTTSNSTITNCGFSFK